MNTFDDAKAIASNGFPANRSSGIIGDFSAASSDL